MSYTQCILRDVTSSYNPAVALHCLVEGALDSSSDRDWKRSVLLVSSALLLLIVGCPSERV